MADLDLGGPERRRVVLLEVEARLRRLAFTLDTPGPTPPDSPPVGPSKAEDMARLVVEHFAESWRAADIARAAGLHPNYAMTLFRDAFGVSIGDYLTQHRVARAQQLLVTSEAGVLDIALQSGFGSASRFYAAFKQACGLSPHAYRASLHLAPSNTFSLQSATSRMNTGGLSRVSGSRSPSQLVRLLPLVGGAGGGAGLCA